jgi:hypothetical protein
MIGVDFGTTTKVVWQDLSDNKFEVFRWERPDTSLASLLMPSSMTLRNGSIHFGLPAQGMQEGDVRVQSLRACILCRHNPTICHCDHLVGQNGLLRLPGLDEKIPASSAASVFLAYVFREVENRLLVQFQDDDLVLIWNIGCPIDQLGDMDRRAEWEKMVGVALEIRGRVTNSIDASLIVDAKRLIETFGVAPPAERNYSIQPEGLACREGISAICSRRAHAASS